MMPPPRSRLIAAFAGLLGCLLASSAATRFQVPRRHQSGIGSPVALGVLSSGDVIVLESRGAVYQIPFGTNHFRKLKETIGYNDPVDLATGRIGDQDAFFVTSYWRAASLGGLARLSQYASAGKEVSGWKLPGGGAFVLALDPGNRIIYLADARNSEIYALNLSDPKASPASLMDVPGTSSLSAMAFDVARKRLFVTDVVQGNLYALDLARRKTQLIAERLGEPRALAFDTAEDRLYIADAGRRRIWALDTKTRGSKPTIFSQSKDFREPVGVAVDSQRRVWVADYAAGAVFTLSQSGEVVAQIRD